ncbi:hypothetical protein [Devosia sp.]|uniref:hypothetical protein n=1 Tax=Devosia sp. TaxID=1871048 RepID=UPI00326795E6
MNQVASIALLLVLLAMVAFLAYDWTTASLEVFNVNEALAPDESAVLLGWNMDPAALYVVCAKGEPRRLLASWRMIERDVDYNTQVTVSLKTFHSGPSANKDVEFPASHLQKGARRYLMETQSMNAGTIQAVTDLIDTEDGYQNEFRMGDGEGFVFSSNATAKLGLSTACNGAALHEGQANG